MSNGRVSIWKTNLVLIAALASALSWGCQRTSVGTGKEIAHLEGQPSPEASSNPGREGDSVVSQDRATARRRAELNAFRQGLIRHRIWAKACGRSDGDWIVHFGQDDFRDDDGRLVGHPPQLSLLVFVKPDGRCYEFNIYSRERTLASRERLAAIEPLPEVGRVNEAAAVLLATAFARREGLIPTATVTREVRAEEGGWFVGFTPGVYRPLEGEVRWTGPLAEFVVWVGPDGTCAIVDFDLVGYRKAAPP